MKRNIYFRQCLKNAKEGDSSLISPCLRPKGHEGKCKHKELCSSPSCTCGGLSEKMSQLDKRKLVEYRTKMRLYMDKMNEIHKKYEVIGK